MRLVISLATRGRPDQLLHTMTADLAMLSLDSTTLMVHVDHDDHPTIAALNSRKLDPRVKVTIKDREDTIAEKWNRSLSEPADLYLLLADDDPIVTPNADVKLHEAAQAFPDGIGMVYGHMVNASFSSIYAFTAKYVEKLGWLQPEYFPYWFCDHWTDDLARMIGRLSFADVRTDQRKAGKTQEMREPGWWATWYDAAYLLRERAARAIIESPDFHGEQWQKDLLIRNLSIHYHRSCWINQGVRNISQHLEQYSGLSNQDPRYQRVKDKAIAMIPDLLVGMPTTEANTYRVALNPPPVFAGLRKAYA